MQLLQELDKTVIAIGYNTVEDNQGVHSIAIGANIANSQANNSIAIDATNSYLNANIANALFVKPIRNNRNDQTLVYDTTTGEISYPLYKNN